MSLLCPECQAASVSLHHGFAVGCPGCAARSAARSPEFFEGAKSGKQTSGYRRMLRALSLAHDQVKSARAADAINKGA